MAEPMSTTLPSTIFLTRKVSEVIHKRTKTAQTIQQKAALTPQNKLLMAPTPEVTRTFNSKVAKTGRLTIVALKDKL